MDIAGQNTEKRAPFAGRLRLFNTNWHIITKDQWVIQAINGHRIDWCGRPHQYNKPFSNRFSSEEEICLNEEVQKMTRKGAVEIVHRHPEDGFHSNLFLVPKTEIPKQLCSTPPFQDGGNSSIERHHETRGLDDESRPKRCIFLSTNMSRGQKISPLQMEKQDISVQLPTFWYT